MPRQNQDQPNFEAEHLNYQFSVKLSSQFNITNQISNTPNISLGWVFVVPNIGTFGCKISRSQMINTGTLAQIWDMRTGSPIFKWYWSELERRIIGFKTKSFTQFWSSCIRFHFPSCSDVNISFANWPKTSATGFPSNRIKINLGAGQFPFFKGRLEQYNICRQGQSCVVI